VPENASALALLVPEPYRVSITMGVADAESGQIVETKELLHPWWGDQLDNPKGYQSRDLAIARCRSVAHIRTCATMARN
jgi:hypothetical protein